MKRKTIVLVLVLALFAAIIIPLAANEETFIIGYWDDNVLNLWSFFEDGTYTLQDWQLNYYVKGTWQMVNNRTISLTETHRNSWESGAATADALNERETPITSTYAITVISASRFQWLVHGGDRSFGFTRIRGQPVYRAPLMQ